MRVRWAETTIGEVVSLTDPVDADLVVVDHPGPGGPVWATSDGTDPEPYTTGVRVSPGERRDLPRPGRLGPTVVKLLATNGNPGEPGPTVAIELR